MRAFITVFILMTFIATGNALVCEACVNRNSSTCTGELETCDPDVTTCEHSIAEIVYDGQPTIFQIFKGCSKKPCNPLYFTMSYQGMNGRLKRVCCEDDSCNNGTITLPPRNDTLNGRNCPACWNIGSFECSQIRMDCKGDETGCAIFKGVVDLPGGDPVKMVAMGCINMEQCDPPPDFPLHFVPENYTLECTPGKE